MWTYPKREKMRNYKIIGEGIEKEKRFKFLRYGSVSNLLKKMIEILAKAEVSGWCNSNMRYILLRYAIVI